MATADLGPSKGRVDFEFNDFDKLIRDKGLLAQWSRGVHCPCRGNAQTDQADPNCSVCGGDGWFYILPREAPALQDHINVGHVQTSTSMATQALVQSVTRDPQIFEQLGEWIFGTVKVNTFSWHRFAYRDRFTLTGAVMAYQQTLTVGEDNRINVGVRYADENLRYPVVELLEVYKLTADGAQSIWGAAQCLEGGHLLFDTTVSPDDRVTIHYAMNPVLIVMDHVYALRDSPIAARGSAGPPLGTEVAMPRHAMARLDFLVSP